MVLGMPLATLTLVHVISLLGIVAGAILAFRFNMFVLVAQSFAKISFLKPLAPTQSEPPFLVAQVIALVIFIAFGVPAIRRFRPAAVA